MFMRACFALFIHLERPQAGHVLHNCRNDFGNNSGTLFRCCVLGHGTSPSNASLDSGVNEFQGKSMKYYVVMENT